MFFRERNTNSERPAVAVSYYLIRDSDLDALLNFRLRVDREQSIGKSFTTGQRGQVYNGNLRTFRRSAVRVMRLAYYKTDNPNLGRRGSSTYDNGGA